MADLENLAENEAFIQKLAETKSPEEALALFKAHGVAITKEELLEAIRTAGSNTDDELNENSLDDVSGGYIMPRGSTSRCVSRVINICGKKLTWTSILL